MAGLNPRPGAMSIKQTQQLARLVQSVREPFTVMPPLTMRQDVNGLRLGFDGTSLPDGAILARITSSGSSTGSPTKYAFVEQDISYTALPALSDKDGGITGTIADDTWALEINNATVANDTIVLLHRDPVTGRYWFDENDLGGGSGSTVFVEMLDYTGTNGQEDGFCGTLVINGGDTQFNSAGPLLVEITGTAPSTATLSVREAHASVSGIMSTSLQSVGGTKNFVDGVIADPSAFDSVAICLYQSHYATGDTSVFSTQKLYDGVATIGYAAMALGYWGDDNAFRLTFGITNSTGVWPGNTAAGHGFYFEEFDENDTSFVICGPSARYCIYKTTGMSLTLHEGASQTAAGLTFVGGIFTGGTFSAGSIPAGSVTGLDEAIDDRVATLLVAGTGITLTYNDGANTLTIANSISAYTDEAAQDAIGTILVDSDTIEWTYTDGTPAIAADVKMQESITSTSAGIKLVGDLASPGNDMVYGTSGGGSKGWYSRTASSAMQWQKYSKTYSQLSAAGTTLDVELVAIGARGWIQAVIIKSSTAFTGTGLASLSLDVGITGNLTKYVWMYNGVTAVSDTHYSAGTGLPEPHFGGTSLRLQATSSGCNLNALTNGAVDVYVLMATLPV